jgi:hypothetical protein
MLQEDELIVSAYCLPLTTYLFQYGIGNPQSAIFSSTRFPIWIG